MCPRLAPRSVLAPAAIPESSSREVPAGLVEEPRRRGGPRQDHTALVEQAPEVGLYWTALGAARYALGDYRAAIAALENGARPPSGRRSSPRLFLLAMAHWQLGEKGPAWLCYTRAVASLTVCELPAPGNRRLRAEAEALLGVRPPQE